MKYSYQFIILLSFSAGCSGQEKVSEKVFNPITLVNKIDFYDAKLDQSRFSCGFLLTYKSNTFAVTAKHLLKIIKPDEMKTLTFENIIKSWSMFQLDDKTRTVLTDRFLNQNKNELLENKSTYSNDWLLFSIKDNKSKVQPLQIRVTPLAAGEKLYAVGWTRKMEGGPQRVYEFEYFKTVGNRLLLKDVVVPETFGGLSGAPVVDEAGLVVGIVSGGTEDPYTKKKYFSPCNLEELIAFLEKYRQDPN